MCAFALSLLWEASIINHKAIAQNSESASIPRVCSQDLSAAITKIINHPKFKRSRWGIEIQVLATGESLYSLNGEQFFTPASSAKLLTTAAVLSELGANYQITTPLYSVGKPPYLASLRLKGQGDPTISTKSLKTIVHRLQQQGIERIEKLIVDDSYFAAPTINPTWEWTDLSFTFVDKNILLEFFKPNKLKKIYKWLPVIVFNDRLPNTFDF